ncbi:MAG: hypothetical protein ACKO1F_00215 [Flammeovirgaceae bacterium]
MKRISLTIALVTISFFVIAQENDKESRAVYKKSFESMKFIGNSDYFFDRKVNLMKSAEFKTLGIDLNALAKKAGGLSFNENLLMRDLVILGTISGREYDTNPQAYYHTKYTVDIDQVIKGRLSKSRITVVSVSGALGVDSYMNVSGETSLFLGEKVILCLNNVDVKRMKTAKANGTLQKEINIEGTEFDVIDKYPLKAGYVFDVYNKKVGTLNEVKIIAKKIESINDSENFVSRLSINNPNNK